jgi:hypothetical protein
VRRGHSQITASFSSFHTLLVYTALPYRHGGDWLVGDSFVSLSFPIDSFSQGHHTKEKTFLSWEGTSEEDAKRATRLANHLTTRPGLSCPDGLICHVTKHMSPSRVYYSHNDLGKELQDFAGKLEIGITAMLVYSYHSFKPAQYKC